MSDPLRPGELNCRITLSYVETERGELGETLPAREVSAGKALVQKGAGLRSEGPDAGPAAGRRNVPLHAVPA